MEVTKQFIFHAAHRDEEAPDQCGRLHGHTYKLEVTVKGNMRERMLIHGDILKDVYRELIEPCVEHQYLNEMMSFNPTMENVVSWIAETIGDELLARRAERSPFLWTDITCVLWETPTMYATTSRRLA